MKDLIHSTLHSFRDSSKRYIVNEGGTRSGKTYAVLSCLYLIADSRPNQLISVVSETYPHLRKGAIRDFKEILIIWDAWQDDCWNKTESTYSFANGSQIEFFSVDSPSKVHGPARDHLFMNEAQNISAEIARHLFVRTSGKVFIDFNPTREFWAHELKQDEKTAWIHSTYLDNPFLKAAQVEEIERNKRNATWWQVYGLGLIGQLEGLVFPSITLIDQMPDSRYFYGLDFGYSQDPTALVRCAVVGDNLYLDELIYQTGLLNRDISQLMTSLRVNRLDSIYCDSAEPKSIDELYLAGWNVFPTVKGKDSIMYGIDMMKQFNIHVTKRSNNLIKEFRNYTFAQDKEGKLINKPIDLWNHGIDAVRYAVTMKQVAKQEYREMNTYDNTRQL